MTDGWKERKIAQEEEYFRKKNELALKRIQENTEPARISPVTGKPMKQETFMGVVIDRCESGGVWLDNGELEEIINHLQEAFEEEHPILKLFVSLKK